LILSHRLTATDACTGSSTAINSR